MRKKKKRKSPGSCGYHGRNKSWFSLLYLIFSSAVVSGGAWASLPEGLEASKHLALFSFAQWVRPAFSLFLSLYFILYSARLARGVQKGYEGIKKSRTTEPVRSDPVWSLYFDLVNNFKNNLQNCINRLGRGHKPAQWKKATEWHLKWSSSDCHL